MIGFLSQIARPLRRYNQFGLKNPLSLPIEFAEFSDLLPKSASSGTGVRTTLASVLLMGLDVRAITHPSESQCSTKHTNVPDTLCIQRTRTRQYVV